VLERSILFGPEPVAQMAALTDALAASGLVTASTACKTELFSLLQEFTPECLVILITSSEDNQALQLAREIRNCDRHCSLLLVTPSVSVEFALAAMKAGVSDVLDHAAPPEKIRETIASLMAHHSDCRNVSHLAHESPDCSTLIGSSAAMSQIRKQVMKVAAADCSVLITGESGTGKELVAQMIHERSGRSARPFVAVNCAALPETLLESELFGYERGAFTGAHNAHEGKLQHAAGGTLFLDEVGEMSLMAQAKILRAVDARVIQRLGSNVDTRVQVRLVAATNQDLERLVDEKRFRQDLYYRLNVVRLSLPPLRERLEDIPELVLHILRDLMAKQRAGARNVEGDVVHQLQQYDWPGNVRELRNVLESILVFSSSRSIQAADIPIDIRRRLRSSKAPYSDERSNILSALDSAYWNRNEAAKKLSCSRMTLYRKMGKYGIAGAGRSSTAPRDESSARPAARSRENRDNA
jgi:DNA-binding NtrC family response regulator